MRVLLRIKWSALGVSLKIDRRAWGISHDQEGNWTIGKLPDPKESEFKTAKTIFNKWGITMATVNAALEHPA